MTTTTTSGAADMPEALRRSTAADGKTELFNLPGYPLMVRAVDFNRIHTESEMRRTALLDEMQKAALAAGQATAAQPGVVYAELPAPNYPKSGGFPGTFAEAQMRDFADRTHALRMQAAPKAAPVADEFRPCPSCFGTGVEGDVDDYGRTIDVSCGDCNGSGRARVEAATEPDTAPSRYREACTQGGRCLGGCFITEPCYLTVREMARAALAAQGGKDA